MAPTTPGNPHTARTTETEPQSKSNLRPFILQGPTETNPAGQLPSFFPPPSNPSSQSPPRRWARISKGWRIVAFHSWLNLLLVFIPISWTVAFTVEKAHSAIFALCVLSLIPLVKLHDLCTRELAIRIGGNKTGLVNASMSNMVEIVVAISALRQCELRVVQSALVGSILSKLLLVLGLCFFAGGMRFSEQGFDATATQIHSSLMSISVGAILLPAAYHFTLDRDKNDLPLQQGKNILHMSHGVSIVLLFIYCAYLVFQLWSHSHLYHDEHNKKSQRLPVQVPVKVRQGTANLIKNAGKRIATSFSALDLSKTTAHATSRAETSPTRRPYPSQFSVYDSSITLNTLPDVRDNTADDLPGTSTVRLVNRPGVPFTREDTFVSSQSSDITVPEATMSFEDISQVLVRDDDRDRRSTIILQEPQLSWPLTLCLMLVVTIAVAVTAESLVESMDGISSTVSKEWIGLIVLPSVSAIAECITAINVSVRDELTLSVSVAVGSSIQTALFVFPFMVMLGWVTHKPLSLLLDPFQSLVLYLSVQIMSYVVADGKSNWLEGVILICLYVIVAVSFWFYPGSNPPGILASCPGPVSDPF